MSVLAQIMNCIEVEVHPLTNSPNEAWEELSKNQTVEEVQLHVSEKITSDKLRIVCMSDTHSRISRIKKFGVPDGDIFIHAGDFTRHGSFDEVINFNEWLGGLPHKCKVVIAGNHELCFDKTFSDAFVCRLRTKSVEESTKNLDMKKNARAYLTNCTYLEDEEVILHGLKIYGTPWQPEYSGLAFNLPRGQECLEKWNKIPADTDILVSHTPPLGHGDLSRSGVRAGCVELLFTVQQRVRPKYHIFGHIHEGYGVTSDGKTTFVNASTCNVKYKPVNPPIVFDIPLPPGYTKHGRIE